MIEIDTKSPAKINLYLRILNKRNDGYHNIETSFQYIDLYDFLNFKESKHDISIESDNPVFKNTNNTFSCIMNILSISCKKTRL